MRVSAGQLNRRVTIKRWHDEAFGSESTNSVYDTPVSVWASVQPVSGATFHTSAQTGEAVTHRFTFRRVVGVTDPETVGAHSVIESAGWRYKVVRTYDLFDRREFTVVEAIQLDKLS